MDNTNKQAKYAANPLNSYAQLELINWIDPSFDKILDLGCGDGKTTREIKKIFPNSNVFGLTANRDEASENSTDDLQIIFGDAHDLPFEDSSFNVVFARHILEHCIAPLKVLEELNRILEAGGQAIISVPSIEEDWILNMQDHYSVLPEKMWEKLFNDAGFKLIKKEIGTWLAYYSMKDEKEYRYLIEKHRDLKSGKAEASVFHPSEKSVFIIPPSKEAVNPLAFVINNFVTYETLKPLLENLKIKQVGYDILIPLTDEPQAKELFEATFNRVSQFEENVKMADARTKEKYKIAFYPFLPFYFSLNADYDVRYQYGIGKPSYNFDSWSMNFDYILSSSNYDSKYLERYTQNQLIGPLKFANFNVNTEVNRTEKLNVLYMPTYGELSSIDDYAEKISQLKSSYNIKVKLHHMTSYFEKDRVEKIQSIFNDNDIYTHLDFVTEIFSNIDMIVSDGSGAMFDAIAAGIPVIVVNPERVPAFEDEMPLENKLIESKVIKSIKVAEDLEDKLNAIALNLQNEKQNIFAIRSELYPVIGEQSITNAMQFIKDLMQGDINHEALVVQRKIRKTLVGYQDQLNLKEKIIDQLTAAHKNQRDKVLELIDERNERINELSKTLNDFIKFDAEKLEKIQEQASEIVALQSKVLNFEQKFESLHDIQNLLAMLEENYNYTNKLNEQEAVILNKTAEISALQSKTQSLEEKVAVLDSELEKYKNKKFFGFLKGE